MLTTQADRELLELAARAAGLRVEWVGLNVGDLHLRLRTDNPHWFNWEKWNPLEDDGDALRLAVQLGMEIDAGRTSSCAFRGHIGKRVAEEAVGEDRFAATRRVIVRLAAGIGESIP